MPVLFALAYYLRTGRASTIGTCIGNAQKVMQIRVPARQSGKIQIFSKDHKSIASNYLRAKKRIPLFFWRALCHAYTQRTHPCVHFDQQQAFKRPGQSEGGSQAR